MLMLLTKSSPKLYLSSVRRLLHKTYGKSILYNTCRTFRVTSNEHSDVYPLHKIYPVKSNQHSDVYASSNNLKQNDMEWVQYDNKPFYQQFGSYAKLSKIRLSFLVTASTVAAYFFAPGPTVPLTLLCVSVGTLLCSSSANAFNHLLEVPYDCQMRRCYNRPLVRGKQSLLDAAYFAVTSGVLGCTLLATMVNMPTACLGLANIVLYAGVYTLWKQRHIINTWIGAVVGAIPTLMGWAACTGTCFDVGALIFFGLLFSWQFPHFNALSWKYKDQYASAGYRMMCVSDPDLCRRVALRYGAIFPIPLAVVASCFHFTDPWFPIYFLYFTPMIPLADYSYSFYKNPNFDTADKLFWCTTMFYLPAAMVLYIISKYIMVERERIKMVDSTNKEDSISATVA